MNADIFKRIPFTENDKSLMSLVKNLTSIKELNLENAEYFMVRTNTQSITSLDQAPTGLIVTPPGQPLPEDTVLNIDTFIISTSADPDEKLTYTAKDDVFIVDDKIDGGFF